MKTTIEVLDRMDSIVVRVHQTHGPDEHETTLVLDDEAAASLNIQLARLLAKRRFQSPPELRWFKIRKTHGRAAGVQYIRAIHANDAVKESRYSTCHSSEIIVSMLARGIIPPT